MRQVIGNVSGVSWPPDSSKLSDKCMSTLIPSEIHNVLTWVISTTPIDPYIEGNSKVDVPKGYKFVYVLWVKTLFSHITEGDCYFIS